MIKNGVGFLGDGIGGAADAATGAAENTGKKLLDAVASPFKKN
jgi:hypothetical protein